MNLARQQHDADVEKIRMEFLHSKGKDQPFTLNHALVSNTTRSSAYKRNTRRLSIDKLNRVLGIDTEKRLAWVEPRVTMQQLLESVLPYGLMVPVMPEFKGITVGGAIMGAAIESSSHRWGQFNDICTRYEILLGNGALITASPEENSDLFYGISGSYGTLGLLMLVEIKLIPAGEGVNLFYHTYGTPADAISAMGEMHRSLSPPDFLEGVVFSKNHTVVVEGRLEPKGRKSSEYTLALSHPSSPWFYQHIAGKAQEGRDVQDLISIPDYIFRHDRGAFWMGGYALHPSLLLRYGLEAFLRIPEKLLRKIWPMNRGSYSKLRYPGTIFRSFFGWAMSSEFLYSVLHFGTEKWFSEQFVIQDFYLPEKNASVFIAETLEHYGITPIWLCPVKATRQPQFLSPHYQKNSGEDPLLFDVGIYGMSGKEGEGSEGFGDSVLEITRHIEQRTNDLGGRKMFYSYSYCTPEEFWKVYSKVDYSRLRQLYQAEGIWLSIEDKILFSDPNPIHH